MARASKSWLPWGVAGVVVLLGWYSGYELWDPDSPGERPYVTYFDAYIPALTVAVGLPLCVLAGMLVGRPGWRTVAGYVLLTLGTLAMAYLASAVFFGGFCVDPGDPCITSWPSRIAAPLVALACLGGGFGLRVRRLETG